jgi:hypothetical protein
MPVIRNTPSQRVVNGNIVNSSEIAIVSDSDFRTKGEGIIVVKNIDFCKISLDQSTTDHITIKALTKVLIQPMMGLIDDEYQEMEIDKGACVEMAYCAGGWYILSSDGLKFS